VIIVKNIAVTVVCFETYKTQWQIPRVAFKLSYLSFSAWHVKPRLRLNSMTRTRVWDSLTGRLTSRAD